MEFGKKLRARRRTSLVREFFCVDRRVFPRSFACAESHAGLDSSGIVIVGARGVLEMMTGVNFVYVICAALNVANR
jgi:hypothetical protein